MIGHRGLTHRRRRRVRSDAPQALLVSNNQYGVATWPGGPSYGSTWGAGVLGLRVDSNARGRPAWVAVRMGSRSLGRRRRPCQRKLRRSRSASTESAHAAYAGALHDTPGVLRVRVPRVPAECPPPLDWRRVRQLAGGLVRGAGVQTDRSISDPGKSDRSVIFARSCAGEAVIMSRPGPTQKRPGGSLIGDGLRELSTMDRAVYEAVATVPTPSLDGALARLSNAANHSKLWLATAAVLAAVGGKRGRQAAQNGVASVVVSVVTNIAVSGCSPDSGPTAPPQPYRRSVGCECRGRCPSRRATPRPPSRSRRPSGPSSHRCPSRSISPPWQWRTPECTPACTTPATPSRGR